jgi:hypothetical protein
MGTPRSNTQQAKMKSESNPLRARITKCGAKEHEEGKDRNQKVQKMLSGEQ